MMLARLTLIIAVSFATVAVAGEQSLPPMHLTLAKAMVMVSKENAQVFAANERVRQAMSNITASRSGLLPQVTGIFGGKRQTSDLRASGIALPGDPHVGPFNSFDTRLRLTMSILDPSAIDRLKSAKAAEKLSQAEYRKIRQDIMAMTGALFLEAQRSSQAVRLIRTQLTQAKHQDELAKLKFKQGIGSDVDVQQARMQLAQAKYQLKAAQVHAKQTRLDLAAALRLPAAQEIIFDDDHQWERQELSASTVSPDVAVSQAQRDLSQAAVSEARSGFWPKLIATGDYGRLGETPSNASNTYSLGLGISLPLWEGGIRQAQLAKARSQLSESDVLLDDAKNQDQVKVKEARDQLSQAIAFVHAQAAQLDYINHQWHVMKDKLGSGLASRLEMDQADAVRASSMDEYNEAKALYWTAKINLAHAMGRLDQLFGIK